MHELSIAYNLVEIAQNAAHQAGATQVRAVHLQLGAMSGVVESALRFGYDIATQGTLLEGSTLQIETVPVVVYCPTCAAERTLKSIQLFQCPVCETPTADVRQGRELEILYLEIDDETETLGDS